MQVTEGFPPLRLGDERIETFAPAGGYVSFIDQTVREAMDVLAAFVAGKPIDPERAQAAQFVIEVNRAGGVPMNESPFSRIDGNVFGP